MTDPGRNDPGRSELSPALLALKAELGSAIRRDGERRRRRRKAIRTSTLSLGALLALSGSALAAGDAIGVIQLGGGVDAAPVSSIPVLDEKTDSFYTGKPATPYTYHLTGGEAIGIGPCGPTDPHPTNNIYVQSSAPLGRETLQEIRETVGDGKMWPHIPGVSISNGCPTPGVAGQPGTPGSPAVPGKAAVTVAPSASTPRSTTAPAETETK
jgi:hypothetical protein